MLLCFQPVVPQNTAKLETIRKFVETELKGDFSKVGITENGYLYLMATKNYSLKSASEKIEIMDKIAVRWQNTLILVKYGTKSELWKWNEETKKSKFLDIWDLDEPVQVYVGKQTTSGQAHPWFFYIGGYESLDKASNANMSLNTRLGFFLLKNRWDMALSFSGGLSGNIDADAVTSQTDIGLMSRLYFPIQKLKISPNIGGELSMNTVHITDSEPSRTTIPSLLLGINWYIGPGSLDVGVRIHKGSTTMIGYTFMF